MAALGRVLAPPPSTVDYRLWTDADNRAFLAARYPGFLPVYDGYPEPITRADTVRYTLLDHFGGVQATSTADLASGSYVRQWDDDPYAPERLDVQMAAILGLGATACFLAREGLWWPARRMLAVHAEHEPEDARAHRRVRPRHPRTAALWAATGRAAPGSPPAAPSTVGAGPGRNHLLARALADEEWVLWLVADVTCHPHRPLPDPEPTAEPEFTAPER